MPWLIAIAGIAVIAAWTKMRPQDQNKVLGIPDKTQEPDNLQ